MNTGFIKYYEQSIVLCTVLEFTVSVKLANFS